MKIAIVGNNFSKYDDYLVDVLAKMGDIADHIAYSGIIPNRFKFSSRALSFVFYQLSSILSLYSRFMISRRVALESRTRDMVLIINGSFLIEPVLRFYKTNNNLIVWIMDPISKFPRVLNIRSLAQSLYSYSEKDCKYFKLKFLPLFSALNAHAEKHPASVYDIAFVGALDEYRLYQLEELARASFFFGDKKIYLGGVFGRLSRAHSLFLKSPYFNCLRHVFVKRRHSFSEISDIYIKSKAIFNYNVGDHAGASMRFFEALSLGIPQVCDYSVAYSRYSRLILKIKATNYILDFPAYVSTLSYGSLQMATSAELRLQHIKKRFLRICRS